MSNLDREIAPPLFEDGTPNMAEGSFQAPTLGCADSDEVGRAFRREVGHAFRSMSASLLIRNMAWTSKTAEPDAWLLSSPTPKRLTWRAFKQSTSDDLVGSAIMPAERIEMLGSPPPI